MEWLVAQEIWRRRVLGGSSNPEALGCWGSKEHEIDFVTPDKDFIEIKRGKAGPIDLGWFSKVFPRDHLTVICSSPFTSRQGIRVPMEQFLLSAPTSLEYSE